MVNLRRYLDFAFPIELNFVHVVYELVEPGFIMKFKKGVSPQGIHRCYREQQRDKDRSRNGVDLQSTSECTLDIPFASERGFHRESFPTANGIHGPGFGKGAECYSHSNPNPTFRCYGTLDPSFQVPAPPKRRQGGDYVSVAYEPKGKNNILVSLERSGSETRSPDSAKPHEFVRTAKPESPGTFKKSTKSTSRRAL
jgi:hypothetical protein